MNGYQYAMGGAYCTRCEFASIKGFGTAIEPFFRELPFEHSSVQKRLTELIEEWRNLDQTEAVDNEIAIRFLLANDLEKISEQLKVRKLRDPIVTLPEHRDKYITLFRELGLKFSEPQIFIVDAFPKPYDKMDWTATSPDKADERDYGIARGTYFKKHHLIPYRSDFLLAHEMVHHIVGEVDPDWLARGLEEGLTVTFGELYIGSKVIGSGLSHIYTEYHWLDYGATQLKKTYTDYSRQAAAIYKRFGLEGILALIHGGRPKIKEVEKACLNGEWNRIDLPKGSWDDEYMDILDTVTMGFIRNLVVSPLTRYISQFVEVGDTIHHVADKAIVTTDAAKTALNELQHKTFLTLTADDRIDYSDIKLVETAKALRYDI